MLLTLSSLAQILHVTFIFDFLLALNIVSSTEKVVRLLPFFELIVGAGVSPTSS